jgi:putative transposase
MTSLLRECMARKLRIEYGNARYHVINRGNYREPIFAEAGAREAFMTCLAEAVEKTGWVVHAFVLMNNHYHLALETPQGNLVEGMRWLQATFANRFNRFRGEHGHVFQGRYKALLVEGDGLGAVAHYIHLNPVRAGLLPVERLAEHPASSYSWLLNPQARPPWLCVREFLQAAGALQDTPADRARYGEYLAWLAENEPARKLLKFDQMSRGWALGSERFKAELARTHGERFEAAGRAEASTREAREYTWAGKMRKALEILQISESKLAQARKSADWKIAVAAHLKATTTASNPWLADHLGMGTPTAVSRYVSELASGKRPEAAAMLGVMTKVKV